MTLVISLLHSSLHTVLKLMHSNDFFFFDNAINIVSASMNPIVSRSSSCVPHKFSSMFFPGTRFELFAKCEALQNVSGV